jgi:flavin reductase (DIM6/NTAB) family NADH-FMN oxidoreductase RutF
MTETRDLERDLTEAFRSAMRRLASGVALITTSHEGRRFGMTATAVTSLSMEPPSLLVCVNQSASVHVPIASRGAFCVNLLSAAQADLGSLFSVKPGGEARFQHGTWVEDEDGLPILEGSQASISCKVTLVTSHGTHTIFAGEVLRVKCLSAIDPLLYLDGSFGRFILMQKLP